MNKPETKLPVIHTYKAVFQYRVHSDWLSDTLYIPAKNLKEAMRVLNEALVKLYYRGGYRIKTVDRSERFCGRKDNA